MDFFNQKPTIVLSLSLSLSLFLFLSRAGGIDRNDNDEPIVALKLN
jgi:hypothetical protein